MITSLFGVNFDQMQFFPYAVDKVVKTGGSVCINSGQLRNDLLQIHFTANYDRLGLSCKLVHLLKSYGVDFIIYI
jgi:hypothetical protein